MSVQESQFDSLMQDMAAADATDSTPTIERLLDDKYFAQMSKTLSDDDSSSFATFSNSQVVLSLDSPTDRSALSPRTLNDDDIHTLFAIDRQLDGTDGWLQWPDWEASTVIEAPSVEASGLSQTNESSSVATFGQPVHNERSSANDEPTLLQPNASEHGFTVANAQTIAEDLASKSDEELLGRVYIFLKSGRVMNLASQQVNSAIPQGCVPCIIPGTLRDGQCLAFAFPSNVTLPILQKPILDRIQVFLSQHLATLPMKHSQTPTLSHAATLEEIKPKSLEADVKPGSVENGIKRVSSKKTRRQEQTVDPTELERPDGPSHKPDGELRFLNLTAALAYSRSAAKSDPCLDPTYPKTEAQQARAIKMILTALRSIASAQDNAMLVRQWERTLDDESLVIESRAWLFLMRLMRYHERQGLLQPHGVNARRAVKFDSFEEHLQILCDALTTQKTICRHVCSDSYIDGFIDHPMGAVQRVNNNRRVNLGKKTKAEQGAKAIQALSNGLGLQTRQPSTTARSSMLSNTSPPESTKPPTASKKRKATIPVANSPSAQRTKVEKSHPAHQGSQVRLANQSPQSQSEHFAQTAKPPLELSSHTGIDLQGSHETSSPQNPHENLDWPNWPSSFLPSSTNVISSIEHRSGTTSPNAVSASTLTQAQSTTAASASPAPAHLQNDAFGSSMQTQQINRWRQIASQQQSAAKAARTNPMSWLTMHHGRQMSNPITMSATLAPGSQNLKSPQPSIALVTASKSTTSPAPFKISPALASQLALSQHHHASSPKANGARPHKPGSGGISPALTSLPMVRSSKAPSMPSAKESE